VKKNNAHHQSRLKSALPWLLAIVLAAVIGFVYFLPNQKAPAPSAEIPFASTAKPAPTVATASASNTQSVVPTTAGSTPLQRHYTEAERAVINPKPIDLTPGTVLPLTLDPKSNLGIVLGPSVGSLVASPKPRPLPMDLRAWQKLAAMQAIITPRTHEEAAWMDLREFPTEQEMAEVPLKANVDLAQLFAINRLRELAVQVAIICQQKNEKLCEGGVFRLMMLGHPFGTRLMMIRAMEQRRPSYRQTVILACQIGHQLGDTYQPHRAQYQAQDRERVFSMPEILAEVPTATSLVQRQIPVARAAVGLPPLQIVQLPFSRLGY
jgi:hypothetical protein